ncbi:MAG: hypothetical protein EAX95_07610 [Candidatus Thorarchaeota archaeon]|nr:hypothetical protein [Candidatus Thorarchaeota archaeon]
MKIDFELDSCSGHVHIPVMVNGSGPYLFTLDTGAGMTTISKSLAESLGIKTYKGERAKAGGAGGRLIPVEEAKLDSLSIGTMEFSSQKVAVIDREKRRKALQGANGFPDGVIGHSLLKDYQLSINYRERTILLDGSGSERDGFNWTPFGYLEDTHLVLVPTKINGAGPFGLVLDTGSGGNIIPPKLASELGLMETKHTTPSITASCSEADCIGVGGRVRGFATQIEELSVGSVSRNDVMFAVIDLNVISPAGNKLEFGIVGYPFLKDFELILDYPNQRFALVELDLN